MTVPVFTLLTEAWHSTVADPTPVRPFPVVRPLPGVGLAQALPIAEVGLLSMRLKTWEAVGMGLGGTPPHPAVHVMDSPLSVDSGVAGHQIPVGGGTPPVPRPGCS